MNRRDLFKRSLGVPVALAGLGATSAAGPVLVLSPSAVGANLSVFDDGDGRCFTCTLHEQPWPSVGDRVRFDYQATHLLGTVTAFRTECLRGTDRHCYYVRGTVQEFTAKATKDAK